MPQPVLLIERQDALAVVTLNRPDKLNALSRTLRDTLVETFASLAADDEIGVVVLTGNGRAFSAGLDLRELGAKDQGEQQRRSAVAGADVVRAIETCGKPVIGAINGFAITGGFELALACDVLIASTDARFADTHARVGILPGWGLSQKLSRLIGIYRAKELSLTGNYLDAETACSWGLVNRVVAPEDLLDTARSLAADMLECDRTSMLRYKSVIDDGYATDFNEGLELERKRADEHMRTVTADDIAERRTAVQSRGRSQKET